MRLDKFLVHMGIGSRKDVKNLVKRKLVSVNGTIAKSSDVKVDENHDEILVDGQRIIYQEYYYLMLHKPAGYLSTTEDRNAPTVLDLIDGYEHVNLFPVGRLDKDTEGLLILSDDGIMAHEILSPKHHIDKEYYVEVSDELKEELIETFKKPMDLGDFTTMPATLKIIDSHSAYIIIHEGKFHQIKRMFEKVNNKVTYLKRIRMGKIHLDPDLKIGDYRELTKEEIDLLKGEK